MSIGEVMNKIVIVLLGFCVSGQVSGVAQMPSNHPQQAPGDQSADAHGKLVELEGYVRDAFCLMKNPDAGVANDKESRTCMRQCIKGGSSLVILGKDRTVYLPIAAGEAPDRNERKRLLPYAGKMVRITGLVFERGDMHAIAIKSIEPLK